MWKKKRGKWICWLHDAAVTLTLFRLCRSLDYKTSYSPPLMIYIYTYTFFCFFLSALVVGFTSSCWERRRRNSCYVWCSFLSPVHPSLRLAISPWKQNAPKTWGGCLSLWERRGFAFLFFKCFVLSNSSETTMTDLLYIMKHTCTNRDGCDRNNNLKKRSINACGHVTRPIVSPPSLASYGVRVFYLFSLSVYSQCIHHIASLSALSLLVPKPPFWFFGFIYFVEFSRCHSIYYFLKPTCASELNVFKCVVNLLHLPSHFASREKSFDFISRILCFDRSIDGHCLIENLCFVFFSSWFVALSLSLLA